MAAVRGGAGHGTCRRRLGGRAALPGRGGIFCAAAIAIDLWTLILGEDLATLYAQLLVRVGFGVFGLLTIENLWRNTAVIAALARMADVPGSGPALRL